MMSGMVDIEFAARHSVRVGERLVDHVATSAGIQRRLVAHHPDIPSCERRKRQLRAVHPQEKLLLDAWIAGQLAHQLVVVARYASGVLQRTNLMVVEDAQTTVLVASPIPVGR